jgi:hypothetical protein
MTDVIYVIVAAAFFAIALGYVGFCSGLRKGGTDEF